MLSLRTSLALTPGFLLLLLVASPGPGWATGGPHTQVVREPDTPVVETDSAENEQSDGIEALRAELASGAVDSRTHTRLGWLLLGEGDYDAAISSFDQALQLNPRSADAKVGKGAALSRKGEMAAAEVLLRDALTHTPNPVRAHYELGLVYDRLGAPDKALTEFKTAIDKYRQGRR